MQTAIENKLRELSPQFIKVINESERHNVPPGSQSHFKIILVAEKFAGQPLLARHRLVNELLAAEISNLHALALHTYTPDEWHSREQKDQPSPQCLGGDKRK